IHQRPVRVRAQPVHQPLRRVPLRRRPGIPRVRLVTVHLARDQVVHIGDGVAVAECLVAGVGVRGREPRPQGRQHEQGEERPAREDGGTVTSDRTPERGRTRGLSEGLLRCAGAAGRFRRGGRAM
ncbi:MAG: hypothetical protein OXG03_01665, partial [Gammaproteobacteria bacterium]|nr:hypothetical protein [Gammaproteobacteria bacterium]